MKHTALTEPQVRSAGTLNRRRFLVVAACAGAATAMPPLATALSRPEAVSDWRGSALGAPASMRLVHENRSLAQRTIAACVDEIERLETIFSLYRPDSSLVRLNREGELHHPPFELLELLSFTLSLARQTRGAFDPTVQPLYRLFARHFARPGADPAGPDQRDIKQVMASVGHEYVDLDANRIALQRPGMALTLNGIAQGYITDKVADLLRRSGFHDLLIDVGEIRAAGHRHDGARWRAGVAHPTQADRTLFQVTLGDGPDQLPALATSSGSGTTFSPATALHHLLDPATGTSARHHASVTVAAPRATLADGLSTALSVISPASVQDVLAAWPLARAWLTGHNGAVRKLNARA